MNCVICGGNAIAVTERKRARYRSETVEVSREVFQCESCQENFLTPAQAHTYTCAVKDEVRKKHGLLSPKRISQIRSKLNLSQHELEELLGLGPKVVVRWESGKVIQGGALDCLLRLLDREPKVLEDLRQIQQRRSTEQQEYESSGSPAMTSAG
jgi:putative zinc finger/helix-turn-helix YgiT family protein